jgi:hypothetical protein
VEVKRDSDGVSIRTQDDAAGDEARPKLKPLHWDKVRACSDRDMVWDRLKSNSFQLRQDFQNRRMIVFDVCYILNH